jgi:hypothetical protein
VNLDAVQEFQVVADGAPAEFGRSSGGFINVVTKSGTNQLHGTAHEYQRFTALTADLSDGSRYGGFSQEQFGSTIGGPVRKDKLFFFAAYDQQVLRQQAALGKIDWNASARNQVTVRYNFSNSRQENGTFDVDPYARSANVTERDFANTVNGSLNTTLSPGLLNEFRAQFSREDRPREYNGPQIPGQSRPFPDTGVAAPGYRFGLPFFIPGGGPRHALPAQRKRLDRGRIP